MEVRATRSFQHLGNTYAEGDVLSLDQDQGIQLLQVGSVEPIVDLEPFRPPLHIDGVILWEAYLLHARDFPPLKLLLDEDNVQLKPYRLRARQYAQLPKWPGLPAARPRRSARFRRRGLYEWEDWDNPVRVSARNSRVKPGPTPGKLYRNVLSKYLRCAATHFFLERLANKELDALGVGESDLMALKETKIPAGWWRRDIVLDLRENDMWELIGLNPEQPVRRYSEIRVQNPGASQEPGGPGRPTRRDELQNAFRDLSDSGSLSFDELRNTKGVWDKVLRHLGHHKKTSGYSYETFRTHVGPLINQALQTRRSEN